jgi:predicted lipid-binding transport protein (Tim44 family)
MDRRKTAGETMTTTIVAMVRAEITSALLNGKTASVSVAFESEQVSCTKNTAGEVIAGHETTSERLHDTWVFERDITSRNPSWLLVDTDA